MAKMGHRLPGNDREEGHYCGGTHTLTLSSRFLETPSLKKPEWSKSTSRTVDFPEQDESQGEITMAFVGPDYKEMETRKVFSYTFRCATFVDNK